MPPSKNKNKINPVVIAAIGGALLTVAAGMVAFQSNAARVSGSGAMSQLMVAFVTGLTTGGLSCLAVQGGLLFYFINCSTRLSPTL